MQHYALGRDIDIVVLDGARGPGTGLTLPAGMFREPISRLFVTAKNVQRAVVWHGAPGTDWQAKLSQKIPADAKDRSFNMRLGQESFVRLINPGIVLSVSEFLALQDSKSVIACAGIAHPVRFFKHLHSLKVRLKNTVSFSDHHNYSAADIAFKDADIILMTQKDAVKCAKFNNPRIWVMQVDALLDEGFFDWFFNAVQKQK